MAKFQKLLQKLFQLLTSLLPIQTLGLLQMTKSQSSQRLSEQKRKHNKRLKRSLHHLLINSFQPLYLSKKSCVHSKPGSKNLSNPCRLFIPQIFIYLSGVLRRFQHCTGHIMMGSWKGRGNQYIQLVKVVYCKLPTNSKQLPAFPLEVGLGTELRSQRWEARELPLCHRGPLSHK